jgi:hypothetical protein
MRNTADVTGGKPIAVFLLSISGVSAINPLVAFYDIHGGKRKFFFINSYILYIETTRPNTNRHVHADKCLHCAGIEPATSCVVGEYSHHYAKSVIKDVEAITMD